MRRRLGQRRADMIAASSMSPLVHGLEANILSLPDGAVLSSIPGDMGL